MNPIEEIISAIQSTPNLKWRIEKTGDPTNPHWLDITDGTRGVTVEFQEGKQIGVSLLPQHPGIPLVESHPTVAAVVKRLTAFFAETP